MKKLILAVMMAAVLMFGMQSKAAAQRVSLGTNLVELTDLGTINADLGISVAQHFSLIVGGQYNPWTFQRQDPQYPIYNHIKTGYLGVRYWPWYVYSGWWLQLKGQYTDYAATGVWRPALNEGKAVAGGFSFGYALMLGKHFDIEAGVGVMGGKLLDFNLYDCTKCMQIRDQGPRWFVLPDDIAISVSYIF